MKSYNTTLKYIYSYITDRKKLKSDPETALERPKYLLELLGNPQEKIKVIHIAGTSGKGSTAFLTSILLQSQGFKVGLSISPHIIDLRERCQINNNLITEKDFVKTFAEIIPSIEKVKTSKYGHVSYFDIMIAFAFYLFWQKKVDFAVMETGLGGLYDSTNIVKNKNKIVVITKIGLDHQWFLGNSYKKIAFQKAGIIQKKNSVITTAQKKSVISVIKKRVNEKNANLNIIDPEENIKNIAVNKYQTMFDFKFQNLNLSGIKLGLIGSYQAENAAQALAALLIASNKYNFKINQRKIYKYLQNSSFPGRFEIIKINSQEVIIDGAHNPQKMQAFMYSLIRLYPNKKFDFLISFSSGKDQLLTMVEMLKKITPHANHLFVTQFQLIKQDNLHTAVDFLRIRKVLDRLKFKNYSFIKNPHHFLSINIRTTNSPLVITGSLYLISSLHQTINSLKSDLV